ncbi:MAG: HAMP domain-containing protein [Rhodospirillaceae bacterium]|nr:HAMP domain-containing protein [Rhodospirillaceae bacterium]MBT6139570.1 HAMP domain-containing protein [Rhodospirillaceae bacterium]
MTKSLKTGRRRLSRLTARILAINLFAVAILFVGVLYLDRYQNSLIRAELEAMSGQAEIFGRAIAELAIEQKFAADQRLSDDIVRRMLRRASLLLGKRARVFSSDGILIADSLVIGRPGGLPGGLVQIRPLPPPGSEAGGGFASGFGGEFAVRIYERVVNWLPRRGDMPHYREAAVQHARQYQEVMAALAGANASTVRVTDEGELVLSVAVPVQNYRHVLGALMLSIDGREIDQAVRSVRFEILGVFAVVFAITVLLSLYLAGSITRPVQRLAAAAEAVTANRNRRQAIPEFVERRDEIGDLSRAIGEMNEALWQRMDAIERFAADVAHEIKNPLTSVRSAVETATRIDDPEQQKKLLAIIHDDVARLDRLISDISEASRLDAELSRDETGPLDMGAMLTMMAELQTATGANRGVAVRCEIPDGSALFVQGHENRLVQVVRNLLANAVSFSPEGGTVRLQARVDDETVIVSVEDDGPGIPEGKLAAIFDRFYSERPEGEKFGTHSGLGLSISRQIVEAHAGRIWAENRNDENGAVAGARFVVSIPRLTEKMHPPTV